MLRIIVPKGEYYDEKNERFIYTDAQVLELEHSLISISKWESKWHKAFLGKGDKTYEETVDYIRCMTLNKNVSPDVYTRLSDDNIRQVNEYISNPMTATWIPEDENKKHNRETVTSELIYYWMISLNIPPEYQKWHLNRLITLIEVCNIKNSPPKKMSQQELMRRNAQINAARRKKHNSRG